MQFLDRRDFMKESAGLASLISAGYFLGDADGRETQPAQQPQPRGANERLNIAVIGVRA